jgi:hypothetical protein
VLLPIPQGHIVVLVTHWKVKAYRVSVVLGMEGNNVVVIFTERFFGIIHHPDESTHHQPPELLQLPGPSEIPQHTIQVIIIFFHVFNE